MSYVNRKILLVMAVAFAAGAVNAQSGGEVLEVGLQKEIIQESAPQAVVQPQQVIVQQVPQQQVISQPTTYVEAAPLVPSKSEAMRKKRQDTELATEQKIVEKLEESRMQDEKKRADRLFGNKFGNPEQQEESAYPVATQAVVVAPQAPQPSAEDMKKEIAESVKADLERAKAAANKPLRSRNFVSAELGIGEYLDCPCIDVEANIATGVKFGWEMPTNFILEGSFLYSNYYVGQGYFAYKELDQYNFGAGARYSFKFKNIVPNFGGLVSYTYRRYTNPYNSGYYNNYSYNEDEKTYAFDFGFVAGVDFNVSRNMAVGFDYKYMMNISNKSDLDNRYYYGGGINQFDRLEDSDYQVMSLTAKLKF